jgi:hypothetical protein
MQESPGESRGARPLNVYQAIAAVQGELAKTGIAKDRKNEQQKYKFRGIDDVFNALSPLLAETGLCILPSVESREVHERVSAKVDDRGNKRESVLFYVTVRVRFDFVSAADGSRHEVVTYGEAMDSGDKATNKAMSAAYKYACLQTFCIPTEGDNDADATTHEVAARGKAPVFASGELRGTFVDNCKAALSRCDTVAACKEQYELNQPKWNAMKDSPFPDDVAAARQIIDEYNARVRAIKGKQPETVDSVLAGKSPTAQMLNDDIPF